MKDQISNEDLEAISNIKEEIGNKVEIESFDNPDLSSGIEALFIPAGNDDSTCTVCDNSISEDNSIIEQFTPPPEADQNIDQGQDIEQEGVDI